MANEEYTTRVGSYGAVIIPLLLPLEETKITIFYEYQTGNSIFPLHGNELAKISGKVRLYK
jgi:hypothetical protein